MVSRTHPGIVKRLFELEVPEIYEGIVEIKNISREPGSRTKIAVYSREDNVDPVGACVGQKGIRVQAIVDELRGEKIDIIKWSSNAEEYISSSLSPAKVVRVDTDEEEKSATVTVPDFQLSLAIGKEGQNARLAAKLTGWKIDIKSESQFRATIEQQFLNFNDSYDPVKNETRNSINENLDSKDVLEGLFFDQVSEEAHGEESYKEQPSQIIDEEIEEIEELHGERASQVLDEGAEEIEELHGEQAPKISDEMAEEIEELHDEQPSQESKDVPEEDS